MSEKKRRDESHLVTVDEDLSKGTSNKKGLSNGSNKKKVLSNGTNKENVLMVKGLSLGLSDD